MDTAGRLRAMAVLCRQTAARHPDRSWKLLAEAEYWEHLANDAALDHSTLARFAHRFTKGAYYTAGRGTRGVTTKQNSLLASVCLT